MKTDPPIIQIIEITVNKLNEIGANTAERLDKKPTFATNLQGILFGLSYGFFLTSLMQNIHIMDAFPKIIVQMMFISPGVLFFTADYRKGKRVAKLFLAGFLFVLWLSTMLPVIANTVF